MPGVGYTWGRLSVFAAALLALMIAGGGGAAARAKAKPKPRPAIHCPSGARKELLHGKPACAIVLSKPKGSPESILVGAQLSLASSKPRYGHVSSAEQRKLEALRRATVSAAGARAVQAALSLGLGRLGAGPRKAADGGPGHVSADGPTMDGWQTHVDGDATPPPAGEEGGTVDVVGTATKDIPGKGQLKQTQTERNSYAVRKCPDAAGDVPARATEESAYVFDGTSKGVGHVVATVRTKAAATDTGHVGDDGHLRDYDQALVLTVLLQVQVFDESGRNVTPEPPKLWRVTASKKHIRPPIDYGMTKDPTMSLEGVGPEASIHDAGESMFVRGSNRDAYEQMIKAGQQAAWKFYWLGHNLEAQFSSAESSWQAGACVKVSAAPAKGELRPGESTPVAVTVSPPPGETLAPGKLTASASTGSISPGSVSYAQDGHVDLTFTAPSSDWSSGASTTILLSVVSREGSANVSAGVKAAQSGYTLKLTSDMSTTFTPVRDVHGTGSAHYAVSGKATVTNGTGSGALTWDDFSYSDQDVQELCQDGRYMVASFTGTGTDPGTMVVKGLDVSADATLDLVVQDPVEHVRGDFQSGSSACAPFTNYYDFQNWADFFGRLRFEGPGGVSLTTGSAGSQEYTITGWQRSGGGFVKDATYTPYGLAPLLGESSTAHVRLELTPL